jgi:hypothetical protein
MLGAITYSLHVILAGVWLGGVVGTTDYGRFAGAQVSGVGRGRAGQSEVGDRAPVC